MYPAEGTG